jgi:hypothetical protein
MADNVIEDPITPHISSYLRRPLRTLKEAEKTIRDSSEADKAVLILRTRNTYNNPFENVVPRASGQPQTEDSKERERAFSDPANLI